ncbi:unnamed protein product [Adineta ricciae]|uniref:Uncharacterized protein n=1 Tax=Adineta ricciae TaxID=249248 RepID=A0A815FCT2_ADIRI|nr:unnamed protein product [Adineta ricciae]
MASSNRTAIGQSVINLFHGYKPPTNHEDLYVCSNCPSYIPDANKINWLQHVHDFHTDEFDQLVESQKILTRACNLIKPDDDIETILATSTSFTLVEEKPMSTKEQVL